MTDANNASTWYDYDAFGRLKRIAKPGDTLDRPTEEWAYEDFLNPMRITHMIRGVSGSGAIGNQYGWLGKWWDASGANIKELTANFERSIHDGLGWVIQTQRPNADYFDNAVGQEFADMLATIASSAGDNRITPEEAKKIRARWEELKSVTESFVRACESGNFGEVLRAAEATKKPERA